MIITRYVLLTIAALIGLMLMLCATSTQAERSQLGVLVLVGMGILYLVSTHSAWRKFSQFPCPKCHQMVSSQLSWTCGFCGYLHRLIRGESWHSLLDFCKKCGAPPQAVICPYCGERIPLKRDADIHHAAFHVMLPQPIASAAIPGDVAALRDQKLRTEEAESLTIAQIKLARADMNLRGLLSPNDGKTGDAIATMLAQCKSKQQRREALIQFERHEKQRIMRDANLGDDEKRRLLEDLDTDIDQARGDLL
jgi:hypothetical protein